ncbi:hypothetical protein CAPTEDRAFT_206326 [Capitella teleta]|uniref:G-protein coupled receptors family 1 profile domain-containing protein n=1 Tax=Capitella teleta TaxID=283909 RepID=R7TQ00_CAPTE|nr:hypothetical protein CAPTEDRAFT_206326 [Capitella teleta]|eukprot:ELT93115.1 hypothetical protein CAPTEDRAFT_206326 [Capitella teleta]
MDEQILESATEQIQNISSSVAESNLTSSDASCRLYSKFVMHSVVAGVVCILGFLGNSVSFVVLIKDRATPVASFMLRTLAFTDNFFLSFWFLHFSLSDMFMFFGWELHATWLYIRLYTYPFLFIGQTATIWMTVLIALSRYIAVCQPYKAAHVCTVPTVHKGVIAVALFSVIYNLPRFFESAIVVKTDTNGTVTHTFERTYLGDSKLYKIIYFDISYYIICFVLPLVLLAVLNVRLTISYRKVLQRKRRMSNRPDQAQHCDPNITLVLIIVILVFMVCNTPARIVQVVWRYKKQWCMSLPFFLMEISNVLEVLNSSVNFIIYCVFRKKFRTILQETMHCTQAPETSHELMLESRGTISRPLMANNMVTKATQITEQAFSMDANGNDE